MLTYKTLLETHKHKIKNVNTEFPGRFFTEFKIRPSITSYTFNTKCVHVSQFDLNSHCIPCLQASRDVQLTYRIQFSNGEIEHEGPSNGHSVRFKLLVLHQSIVQSSTRTSFRSKEQLIPTQRSRRYKRPIIYSQCAVYVHR